jgi:hypothetical protein
MDRRGDLVDVLAAGALRPHRVDFDFSLRNRNVRWNVQHQTLCLYLLWRAKD